jgi:mono/diheme cytochrome c family protein
MISQMKMNKKALTKLATLFVGVFILGSCSTDPTSPGYEYMPDMYRSPAIEPYVDYGEIRGRINEDVKTKMSAMTPPSFSIPYYGTDSSYVQMMLPYRRMPDSTYANVAAFYGWNISKLNEYDMAKADLNPIKLTAQNSEEVLKKGKELFTYMCQHCHGEKGDGKGPMVLSGAYQGSGIPNYSTLQIAEGQMFYSIYYGKNKMGAHSSQLNKEEIWTLVHYIKRFQDKNYGKFDKTGNKLWGLTAEAAGDTTMAKPAGM